MVTINLRRSAEYLRSSAIFWESIFGFHCPELIGKVAFPYQSNAQGILLEISESRSCKGFWQHCRCSYRRINVAHEKRPIKSAKKYSDLNDTRRFSDGVRLHPIVDVIIRNLQSQCIGKISNAEFNRAAIVMLRELKIISLLNPNDGIPPGLSRRDFNLVQRGDNLPIWMRAMDMRGIERLLDSVCPHIADGGDVIWVGLDSPSRKKRRLH